VKNIPQIALLMTLFLTSCSDIQTVVVPPSPKAYGTGNDYAVGTAQPYPQEVKLAKQRLANFVRRANPRQQLVLDQNPIVAVQANELVAGEIWPLMRELASGRVRTMSYVQDLENTSNYPVDFLLLFDQRTGRLATPDGVLIMDNPRRGAVANFAGTKAVYAGTGWW
jgi:hypothetical protein